LNSASPDPLYPHRTCAFGLRWHSELPLTKFQPDPDLGSGIDVSVALATGLIPERKLHRQHGNVCLAPDGFRYLAGDTASIDVRASSRILIYPGSDWAGRVPTPFFSTVAALLLAARGKLPLHGSAVAIDGKATLICGPSGAGKSTTAARLIGDGALLISDDLSVLHPNHTGGPPVLFAGRRSMRLHPETAAELNRSVRFHKPPESADGKIAVYPPQIEPLERIPLARVVILGDIEGTVPAPLKAATLAGQLFRPVCLSRMRNHADRLAVLAIAAQSIEIVYQHRYAHR
jgi:hypothetical protein